MCRGMRCSGVWNSGQGTSDPQNIGGRTDAGWRCGAVSEIGNEPELARGGNGAGGQVGDRAHGDAQDNGVSVIRAGDGQLLQLIAAIFAVAVFVSAALRTKVPAAAFIRAAAAVMVAVRAGVLRMDLVAGSAVQERNDVHTTAMMVAVNVKAHG